MKNILAGLKINRYWKGWGELCYDRVDFTLFRQITRLSEEEVSEMRHKITRDIDEDCDAQWNIPISSLRFNRPMICSDCLRENSYCRKFWDLPVVTVCPQHHSLLLDICPNCRERITWNRKSVSRCDCGYDWREAGSNELPPSQRRAMRLLRKLECLVERLYFHMGYDTELTPPSNDGGRDVIARKAKAGEKEVVLVDCKLYTNTIEVDEARKILGTMNDARATKGVIVTTSTFSSGAREFADKNPIELIDGDHLIPLLNQHVGSRWPLQVDQLCLEAQQPGVHSHG
jgi:Restriction endonuclease/TniQ